MKLTKAQEARLVERLGLGCCIPRLEIDSDNDVMTDETEDKEGYGGERYDVGGIVEEFNGNVPAGSGAVQEPEKRKWIEMEDQMELGSLLDSLKQGGFKAAANVDEDFPAIKGEYGAKVTVCKPALDRETKEQVGYQLTLKISNTLSGDMADGRLLTRWYRLDGNDFAGQPLTAEAKAEALKNLFNDAFTIGVQLDGSSQQKLEESFAGLFDRPCFVRAWHFVGKNDPDKKIQQFIIKTEKDLKKDAKETKAGKSSRAPF